MAIEPDLAKSLSEEPNQELIAILEKPDDWTPEVVEFARLELSRRSVSSAEINEQLAARAKQKAGEPLTFLEAACSALYGGALGLIGLALLRSQAARFKSEGFFLKSAKSWRIYWMAFGVWVSTILVGVAIAASVHRSRSREQARVELTADQIEQKARAFLQPYLQLGDSSNNFIARFGSPVYSYETNQKSFLYFNFPLSDHKAMAAGIGGFMGIFTNNQLVHWEPTYISF